MPQEPFPSYGQGGEPPLPGAAPGNGDAEPDHIPADEPVQQGLTIHLADVTDPATADLAGLAKDGAVDTMAPGAALLALAEAACAPGTLTGLTDNQVLGLAGAARRLAGVAAWLELAAASEFAGRRVT
ncbi:MAG: hypothetical protein JO242_17945, partial [Streptosporangiaceae bacterium]|nr:hypothetical protein [Streptosporangiaceae bacterium]